MILFDFLLKNQSMIQKKASLPLQEQKVEDEVFAKILHNFLQQAKEPLDEQHMTKLLKSQNSIKLEDNSVFPALQTRLEANPKPLKKLVSKKSLSTASIDFAKPLYKKKKSTFVSKKELIPAKDNAFILNPLQNSTSSFQGEAKTALVKKQEKILLSNDNKKAFVKSILRSDTLKEPHYTKVSKKQSFYPKSILFSFSKTPKLKEKKIEQIFPSIEQKERSKRGDENILVYSDALYNLHSAQNFASTKLDVKEKNSLKIQDFTKDQKLENFGKNREVKSRQKYTQPLPTAKEMVAKDSSKKVFKDVPLQKEPLYQEKNSLQDMVQNTVREVKKLEQQTTHISKEIAVKDSSKKILRHDKKAFLKELTLQNFSQEEKLVQEKVFGSVVEIKRVEQQTQHTLTPKISQNLINSNGAFQRRKKVIEQKSRAQIDMKKPEFIQPKELTGVHKVKEKKPLLQDYPIHDTDSQISLAQESINMAAGLDDQSTFEHFQSSHTSLQAQSAREESSEQFTLSHPQRQTLTLKMNDTLINVTMHQKHISMHFISSAALHFHPDIEEFIANVMQEGGYEKYRVTLKDKQKKVTITSQKDVKSSARKNSSINVKA